MGDPDGAKLGNDDGTGDDDGDCDGKPEGSCDGGCDGFEVGSGRKNACFVLQDGMIKWMMNSFFLCPTSWSQVVCILIGCP